MAFKTRDRPFQDFAWLHRDDLGGIKQRRDSASANSTAVNDRPVTCREQHDGRQSRWHDVPSTDILEPHQDIWNVANGQRPASSFGGTREVRGWF